MSRTPQLGTRAARKPTGGVVRAITCALLSVLVVLGAPGRARAEDAKVRPRVLLIVDDPQNPLILRLSAEISVLDVELVTRKSADRLDAAAREEGAVAAIRVVRARNGVEVWMADATSGRSLLRQVIVDEEPGGPNYNNIALQAAELLRTSLLYEQKEDPPPAAPAPAAPPPDDEATPSDPKAGSTGGGNAGVQAGLGALYSPGGTDTALQAWLSVHYPLQSWLAAGLEFGFPLERGSVSGPEGSAAIGAYVAAATLTLRWQREGVPWFARAGLAGGMVRITTEAHATPPLVSSDASALTGIAYLRAEAGVGIAPWLRFGARGLVGFAIPTIRVEFAGNDAGSWGSPMLGALGFVEVPFG